jgi:ABC-type transport system involved in multi-copper enzyme maturation permease subunit
MKGALAYEWRRITSVRSTYWFTALTLVLGGVIALFIAIALNPSDLTPTGVSSLSEASVVVTTAGASVIFVPVLSAPFCAVLGAMSFGHEYRYGTIKQTLIAIPDRVTMYFAKLTVLVGWILGLAIVLVLLNLAIGALLLTGFSMSGNAIRPILMFIFYNVGFGIAGFSLAAIFRNLAGALVAVLVYPFVAEPIGYNILRFVRIGTVDRLANLFPAAAGRRTMFLPYQLFANPVDSSDLPLHVWGLEASTVVFWGGLVVIAGFALALFLRRDA